MHKNKGHIFILFLCLCLWSTLSYGGGGGGYFPTVNVKTYHFAYWGGIRVAVSVLLCICTFFKLIFFVVCHHFCCLMSLVGILHSQGLVIDFPLRFTKNRTFLLLMLELSKRKLSLSILTKQRERALLSSKSTYLEKFCSHWLNVVIQEVRLKIVNTQLQCP